MHRLAGLVQAEKPKEKVKKKNVDDAKRTELQILRQLKM